MATKKGGSSKKKVAGKIKKQVNEAKATDVYESAKKVGTQMVRTKARDKSRKKQSAKPKK
jgi:hypothetical protein